MDGSLQGSLDPPLMGPSTPPLMGPSGGEGPAVAGLGLFALVRRSAGQGHGQKPPVTLPRYATLESARLIHGPSMGLLRRPTPGEIVEGGRFGPALRAGRAFARHLRKPTCGCAAMCTWPRGIESAKSFANRQVNGMRFSSVGSKR